MQHINLNPLISVVTLTFNSEKYIAACIESVQAQTDARVEHIIVDAGSTDRTIEIVERYISTQAPAFPIRVANVGYCSIPEARVFGVSQAEGDLVAVLDADDDWHPEKLATQARLFVSNPRLVVCGSSIRLQNIDTKTSRIFRFPEKNNELLDLLSVGINPFAHSAVMFRRSAYLATGGYSLNLKKAEDFGLWLSLSKVGELTGVRRSLTTVTVRGDSHTRAFEFDRFPKYLAMALIAYELNTKNYSCEFLTKAIDDFSLEFFDTVLTKSVLFLILRRPLILLKFSVARMVAGALFMRRKHIFRAIFSPEIPSSFADFVRLYLSGHYRPSS